MFEAKNQISRVYNIIVLPYVCAILMTSDEERKEMLSRFTKIQ
tara:strand:- start:863 stop:991 length:129 start_codon:yes stop_codon:yes gene_type:complete